MRESGEWLVIINPNAGRRRGMRDWSLIAGWLNHFKFQYHPVFTEYPGHAIQLTRDLVEKGYKRIIAVGGDGTMNEVVNGVFLQKRFKTTEISLGMITVGTGNDFTIAACIQRVLGKQRGYSVEAVLGVCRQDKQYN